MEQSIHTHSLFNLPKRVHGHESVSDGNI